MTDVAAPADNTWDLTAVAAEAMAALRLRDGDVDSDRVEQCAAAAVEYINTRIDATEPIDAGAVAHLQHAAVTLAVDLYPYNRQLTDLDLDAVAAVRPLVLPSKQRWGVA